MKSEMAANEQQRKVSERRTERRGREVGADPLRQRKNIGADEVSHLVISTGRNVRERRVAFVSKVTVNPSATSSSRAYTYVCTYVVRDIDERRRRDRDDGCVIRRRETAHDPRDNAKHARPPRAPHSRIIARLSSSFKDRAVGRLYLLRSAEQLSVRDVVDVTAQRCATM